MVVSKEEHDFSNWPPISNGRDNVYPVLPFDNRINPLDYYYYYCYYSLLLSLLLYVFLSVIQIAVAVLNFCVLCCCSFPIIAFQPSLYLLIHVYTVDLNIKNIF